MIVVRRGTEAPLPVLLHLKELLLTLRSSCRSIRTNPDLDPAPSQLSSYSHRSCILRDRFLVHVVRHKAEHFRTPVLNQCV